VTRLSAREAYRAWAPHYPPDTALTFLENLLLREFDVPTAGRAVLDAGCGTGHRLRDASAALAVGIDFTKEMLASPAGTELLAVADVRHLPFDGECFDVVWCRLVIGYLRDIDAAYAELARVCRPGGTIVVTDFHPEAAAAGHRRTFRDGAGALWEIENYVHAPEAHAGAARKAALRQVVRRDGEVGPQVRRFYADAGKSDIYDSQLGQRIVLAIRYRRE
jgi:malonyl-CoA O-methyltransferase